MNDSISMVSAVLMTILILLMAYGASRFLGRQWNGFRNGRYMRIIDQLPIGQDRQLLILKIEQEEDCYLLASSPAGVTVLGRLEGQYLPDSFPTAHGGKGSFHFQSTFSSLLERRKQKDGKGRDGVDEEGK